MIKRLILILLIILPLGVSSQVYQWEINTFKNAEKTRKWRTKKGLAFSNKPRKFKGRKPQNEFSYYYKRPKKRLFGKNR